MCSKLFYCIHENSKVNPRITYSGGGTGRERWIPKVLRDQGAVLHQVEKLGIPGSEFLDSEVVTRTYQKVI